MGGIEFLNAFEQVDQGSQVVLKVHEGFFNRFAHRFKGGKMDYARNVFVFLEYRKSIVEITEVNLVILDRFSCDLFHAL